MDQHTDHDSLTHPQERLRLDDHLFERLPPVLEKAPDLVVASMCSYELRFQLDVWMRRSDENIPIPATGGLECGAKRLNVCVGHRPRSIPRPACAESEQRPAPGYQGFRGVGGTGFEPVTSCL